MATSTVTATPIGFDKCDRCSARARLRAVLWSGELVFCVHHAREYREDLLELRARLVPIRE
jgi:hypothetical protein